MATKKQRTDIEWVGALISMPAYVTGEGAPYRPETLFWMGADGAVLGHAAGKPGEVVGQACASLRSTIERPMVGRPHTPARVRVASPALAEALRGGQLGTEVVCGPTPEVDAIVAMMRERLDADADIEQSYLSPDVDPVAMAAFFQATAALFRATPWKTVPTDDSLLSVTIEELGVRDAVLSVIGQMGQSLGLILFAGLDDFEAYVDAGMAMDEGEHPAIPPHLSLNFEPGAELSAPLRTQVADHRWEVAGPTAYPLLVAVDADLVARPPTAREVAMFEALALALPRLLADSKALRAAWNGGAPIERTLVVPARLGDLEVSFRVPCEGESTRHAPPSDPLAALLELGRGADDIRAEARRPLEDELMRRFAASPEAMPLARIGFCQSVMDLAADYVDATIATLAPAALREIVFELIPRKVSIDATAASEIIDELRAFFAFLGREFGFAQARGCARVLGGDAVQRLAAALSDSSKFGMAKAMVMAGREAGFDMETKEGIEAWMRVMQTQPLPATIRLPSFSAGAPPRRRAPAGPKKVARKAARAARKKHR